MSCTDFYEFFPFIDETKEEESFENHCDKNLLSFIEALFPILTSKSQIEILESNLAGRLIWIEIFKVKRFLTMINSPYFTLCFLKKKLIENIKYKVDKKNQADPLFELLYCFEDFLVNELVDQGLTTNHK